MRDSKGNPWPRAYSSGGEGTGKMVFRDWDSGAVLPKFTGFYVYSGRHIPGEQWLMRTWIDQSGERAVDAIRRWDGVLENLNRARSR